MKNSEILYYVQDNFEKVLDVAKVSHGADVESIKHLIRDIKKFDDASDLYWYFYLKFCKRNHMNKQRFSWIAETIIDNKPLFTAEEVPDFVKRNLDSGIEPKKTINDININDILTNQMIYIIFGIFNELKSKQFIQEVNAMILRDSCPREGYDYNKWLDDDQKLEFSFSDEEDNKIVNPHKNEIQMQIDKCLKNECSIYAFKWVNSNLSEYKGKYECIGEKWTSIEDSTSKRHILIFKRVG